MAEEQSREQQDQEQEEQEKTPKQPEGALDTREIASATELADKANAGDDAQPMEDGQSHSPDPEAAEEAAKQQQEKSDQ